MVVVWGTPGRCRHLTISYRLRSLGSLRRARLAERAAPVTLNVKRHPENVMSRRSAGRETWARLLEWDRGSVDAERLAAHVLRVEGFELVDPSHPLGGPDGGKDAICDRDDKKWLAAVYFPRGQQSWGTVKAKFGTDLEGVARNEADGLVFVTNQELGLSKRGKLADLGAPARVEVFHLERISSLLDSPPCYGLRLEFLDIEMTREEQLAFIAARDAVLTGLDSAVSQVAQQLDQLIEDSAGSGASVPIEDLREFRAILQQVTGLSTGAIFGGSVHDLRVPLAELREFRAILQGVSGLSTRAIFGGSIHDLRVPIAELRKFRAILQEVTGLSTGAVSGGSIHDLSVPVAELREYKTLLDAISFQSKTAGWATGGENIETDLGNLREYEATLDRVLKKKKLLGGDGA